MSSDRIKSKQARSEGAGQYAPGDQKENIKSHKSNNASVAPKKPPLVGAIPELDVFDYTAGRTDVMKFENAKKKLTDYIALHYGRNAYVIENKLFWKVGF